MTERQDTKRRDESPYPPDPHEDAREPGDPGPPEMEYPEKGRPVPATVRR